MPSWSAPTATTISTPGTASYATPPAGVRQGVTVDLSKVDLPQDTGGAGIDRLEGIANVIGSPFADRLSGSQVANRFEVRDGRGDTAADRDGADTVVADVQGTDPISADCESVQFDFRPDARIEAGPADLSRNAAPSFRFSSPKQGSTFECSLDGGPFRGCGAVHTLPPREGRRPCSPRARAGHARRSGPEPGGAPSPSTRPRRGSPARG